MPGVNCAIFKCSALQNLKIFKVPTKDYEYSTDLKKKY